MDNYNVQPEIIWNNQEFLIKGKPIFCNEAILREKQARSGALDRVADFFFCNL